MQTKYEPVAIFLGSKPSRRPSSISNPWLQRAAAIAPHLGVPQGDGYGRHQRVRYTYTAVAVVAATLQELPCAFSTRAESRSHTSIT